MKKHEPLFESNGTGFRMNPAKIDGTCIVQLPVS